MRDYRRIEGVLAEHFRRAPGFEIKQSGDVFAQRKSVCLMAQAGEACGELIGTINLTTIAKAIADEV